MTEQKNHHLNSHISVIQNDETIFGKNVSAVCFEFRSLTSPTGGDQDLLASCSVSSYGVDQHVRLRSQPGLTVPWRVAQEDDEDDEDLWDRQEDRLYFILFQVKLKVFTIIVSLICRDETIFNKIRLLEISNLK